MEREKGFTLIELLVVVAIIGILAAIAIPQYSAYRIRSFDSTAEMDLRNAIVSQEAVMVDTQAYVDCADGPACALALPGFKPSLDGNGNSVLSSFTFVTKDVDIVINGITTTAPDGGFDASSKHESGVRTFNFDSEEGVISPS